MVVESASDCLHARLVRVLEANYDNSGQKIVVRCKKGVEMRVDVRNIALSLRTRAGTQGRGIQVCFGDAVRRNSRLAAHTTEGHASGTTW